MSFRYVNPGYVYLLDSDVTATQYTDNEYSKTGVAFTQTKENVGISIPQFQQGDDFWGKFDFYVPNQNITGYIYFRLPFMNKAGAYINYSATNKRYSTFAYCNSNAYNLVDHAVENFYTGAVNTFFMHIHPIDDYTVFVEVAINNNELQRRSDIPISWLNMSKTVALHTMSYQAPISNVIISNEEISRKEQAIALPISATATDMTAGAGGMYTATAAGQTLLQTPDITTFAQQFSGESKITGIQVVGNPAYKTTTGLETMIGLSKSGTVTTEHGSYTLGTDSTALVMDGWGLSGVTLAGLSTMQFGWKTAD